MENNKTQNQNTDEVNTPMQSSVPVKAHTLTEDILHTVEGGKLGAVKEIIDAEEQKEMEKKNFSPTANKNTMYIVLGVLLLLSGVFIAYYFTTKIMNNQSIFSANQGPKDILRSEQNINVDISNLYKLEASRAVYEASQKSAITKGQLARIIIINNGNLVTLPGLLKALDGNFSPSSEFGISENFVFGVVSSDAKYPFLMVNITNINKAFPKIQNWESKMFLDLYGLFGFDLDSEKRYLLNKPFEDVIVKNKNARALLDEDGGFVFMYVFANDNTMIFSTSHEAVEEILERIRVAELQK